MGIFTRAGVPIGVSPLVVCVWACVYLSFLFFIAFLSALMSS